jgi:hypothetical protein
MACCCSTYASCTCVKSATGPRHVARRARHSCLRLMRRCRACTTREREARAGGLTGRVRAGFRAACERVRVRACVRACVRAWCAQTCSAERKRPG